MVCPFNFGEKIMADKCILRKLLCKLKRIFLGEVYWEEWAEKVPDTPVKKYINVLLLDLQKRDVSEIVLFHDAPLPMNFDGFENSLFQDVTYDQVVCRLREMTTSSSPYGKKQIDLVIMDKPMVCILEDTDRDCHIKFVAKNK